MPTEALVHIVDDEADVRDAIALLVRGEGLRAQTHESAQAFLRAYDADTPGCAVVDVRMPGMNGLEMQEALNERGAPLPLLFVSGHGDVPLAVEAMRKGAANFLEKPVEDDVLVQSVTLAARQPGALPRDPARAEALLDRLTPREYQVMELVCSGKLNKIIADILDISIKTVELHRANVMQKMEARTVSELIHRSLGY